MLLPLLSFLIISSLAIQKCFCFRKAILPRWTHFLNFPRTEFHLQISLHLFCFGFWRWTRVYFKYLEEICLLKYHSQTCPATKHRPEIEELAKNERKEIKKKNLRFFWKDRKHILQGIWIFSSVSLEKAAESALPLAQDIMKDLSTGCKILCAVLDNLYLSKWCLSIPQIREITLEESALTPVLSTSSLCTGDTYILQPCSAHSSSR